MDVTLNHVIKAVLFEFPCLCAYTVSLPAGLLRAFSILKYFGNLPGGWERDRGRGSALSVCKTPWSISVPGDSLWDADASLFGSAVYITLVLSAALHFSIYFSYPI